MAKAHPDRTDDYTSKKSADVHVALSMQGRLPHLSNSLIGFLRPIRSRNTAGTRDPTANAKFMQPPPTRDKFLDKPTCVSNTVAM